MRELSNDVSILEVQRRKVAVHTLRQLKCNGALFPPLRRVVEFQVRYGKKTARRFGRGANLDSVRLTVEEK